LGIWLGSLGYLHPESFTYHDSFALFLVAIIGLTYAQVISYTKMFPIVLTIIFIPSFFGYFAKRLYHILKTRHSIRDPNQP
jgi:hypothetical protein